MSAKKIYIEIGQRFGQCITVSSKPHNGKTHWVCRCDCGEEFLCTPSRLNAGTATSCGPCKKKLNGKAKVKDLSGQKLGRLQVLHREGSNQYGKALWLCQCDCGSSPFTVSSHRLLTSNLPTRSCGCISKENRGKNRIPLEGKIFDLLTVNRYLGKDMVECRCQCGQIVSKRSQYLREGRAAFHCGSPICAAEQSFVGPILSLTNACTLGLRHYSPGLSCDKGHRGLYLVSTMSCVECHTRRTRESQINNRERHLEYGRKSRAKPESKSKRNLQLKDRRNKEIAFKFVELIRTRIGKVLRTLKLEKDSAFNRNNQLRTTIIDLMERQGLQAEQILSGDYELDHIIPLASWPWSSSQTANKLTEKAANSASNLQFLTKKQHRLKTKQDYEKYKWHQSDTGYDDHSELLLALIIEERSLPEHLQGHEEIILEEIRKHKSSM